MTDKTPISVNPHEFARAIVAYAKMRRRQLSVEPSWHQKRPERVPTSFVERLAITYKRWAADDSHVSARAADSIEFIDIGDIHGSGSSLLNVITSLKAKHLMNDNWQLLHDNLYIVFTGNFVDKVGRRRPPRPRLPVSVSSASACAP